MSTEVSDLVAGLHRDRVTQAPSAVSADAVSVVVVDSRPLFVFGLEALLLSLKVGIDVLGVATSFEAGLLQIKGKLPDVAIVVSRTRRECLEFAQAVRKGFPAVGVVMLAQTFEAHHVREALRLGVAGYLSVDAAAEDLVNAIRTVSMGEIVLSPLASAALTQPEGDGELPLTEGELGILKLVAEGLDNLEIAQRMFMSTSTLKRHLRCIIDKLKVRNRIQAAVYAARKGLI